MTAYGKVCRLLGRSTFVTVLLGSLNDTISVTQDLEDNIHLDSSFISSLNEALTHGVGGS